MEDANSHAPVSNHRPRDLRTRESLAEQLIQRAMEQGKFDNLEGAGKPIADLDQPYDENWWIRKLIKRDQLNDFWKK